MRTLVSLALLAAVAAAAVPAHAQGALQPTLTVLAPSLGGEASDGIAPGGSAPLHVPWSVSFPNAAVAAEELGNGGGRIAWAMTCPEPLDLQGGPTAIEFTPGETAYEGTAILTVLAGPQARGVVVISCQLNGTFSGSSLQAQDAVEAPLVVAYQGNINVTTPVPSRAAGPQKQIPYPIEVTNTGNARTLVTFALAQAPKGRWNVLVPDSLVLEPGESATALLVVATPYRNGYVKGHADFGLVVSSAAQQDPDMKGPSTTVELSAKVAGLYIPGPQLPLLALALVALAAVRARRT